MRCFETLGLSDEATAAEVESRWRDLRSEHHPDRSGDAEKFDECRKAYEEALREARAPRTCTACSGSGKQKVQRGFSQVRLPCGPCGGTGEIQREQ